MTYTSHGHQIADTPVEDERPPLAGCGGIGICLPCSTEAARVTPVGSDYDYLHTWFDHVVEMGQRPPYKPPVWTW